MTRPRSGHLFVADAWPTAAPGPRPSLLVRGTEEDDYLDGTAFADTLRGLAGNDALQGYAGNDLLDGGEGRDLVYYDDAYGSVTVNLIAGTAFGGSGYDTLISIEDVWGSTSNDTLIGNDEANLLIGDEGNDRISGGAGNDTLSGDAGDDELDGGAGSDIVDYTYAPGGVQVNLGAGTGTGGDGQDRLSGIEDVLGSFYDDTLIGDGETNFLFGSTGDDTVDGGEGDDTASWYSSIDEVTIVLDPATGWLTVTSEYEGTDRVRNAEHLYFLFDEFDTTLFTTPSAPRPIQFGPEAGATDVPVNSDLRVTFQEPVQRGTGSIVLRDAAGREVERFDAATSGRVRVEGMNLVVDPSQPLVRGAGYTLELGANVVRDADGLGNEAYRDHTFTASNAVEVSVSAPSVVSEGAGELVVRVSLNGAAAWPVRMTLTANALGSTTAGTDFVLLPRSIVFEPGQTELLVGIGLLNDQLVEPDEAVRVFLGGVNGAELGSTETTTIITDDDAAPGSLPADPLRGQQWHLYPETGANVLAVWPEYTGAGVRVGVFDQGIDPTHADLRANLDPASGRSTADLSPGGDPRGPADNHGTAVAGVIGAARNEVGGVGVAYEATLVSLYSALNGDSATREIENAFSYALQLDILNDSWGYAPQYYLDEPWAFEDNFLDAEFRGSGAALQHLAEAGRQGLGTIVVQSAGNSFAFGDDTNLHNFQNSRYIITVAATGPDGDITRYSSPGASILVAAPGGAGLFNDETADILTTDRAGQAGYSEGDTVRIAGTSFSAPVVSGVVALMLDANPGLGFRDVQQILASSARRSGDAWHSWQYNGGTHWNGGGLHYDAVSHDMGFGLVDARAAVRLAESWTTAPATAANDVEVAATSRVAVAIPDGQSSVTQSLTITERIEVERVEITIDIAHDYIGDLAVMLRSPAGTESWLLSRPGLNALSAFGERQSNIHFSFNTVLSLGESSLGTWSLTVFDEADADIGTLQSWTLNLVGKPATADDHHVFTDEFAESVARQPQRASLRDTDGIDTLNAAAVSSASRIDLDPGATSTIDGQALGLPLDTLIEHAWGGDGADDLSGNAVANQLHGQRGNDRLNGRGGDDSLNGGAGIDQAVFSGVRSDYEVLRAGHEWTVRDRRGTDGLDTLTAVERLVFADGSMALDTAGNGHAAQAAEILRGLFGPAALTNRDFAGIGLQLLDQGMAYADLVSLAIATPVFLQLAGSRSNQDFVQLVYRQVMGTAPGAAALATYTGLLDSGSLSQAELAVLACQSAPNRMAIELTGLADTGLAFLPLAG